MSGETEKDVSSWTTDTLRYHIQQQLNDQQRAVDVARESEQRRLDQHEHAHEREHAALIEIEARRDHEQQRSVDLALAAEARRDHEHQRAIDLAREASDKRIDERFANVEREFHEHLEAATVENKAALDAAEKAIQKAEIATEKRFEGVNEFRGQLADQAQTFMPRIEAEQRTSALTERLREMELRMQAFPTREEIAVTLTATDAKVAAAADAISEKHTTLTDRIGALELRLTSRLDRNQGEGSGSLAQRTETREERSLALNTKNMQLAALAALVVVITLAFTIFATVHK